MNGRRKRVQRLRIRTIFLSLPLLYLGALNLRVNQIHLYETNPSRL